MVIYMAIWDGKWKRTPESKILDHKVEDALKSVFDWCIKNDIPFEDFHYSVCTEAQELILLAVLGGQSQFEKTAHKFPYPIADNVSVGSVVITNRCLDVGLVAETICGKPVKIYGRYSKFHEPTNECPQYGGVDTVTWYDTGIHMSFQEWKNLSYENDAERFHKYWQARLQMEG